MKRGRLLRHLRQHGCYLKREGRSLVGYGAPGKGAVLLNYCGIREDFLDYLVDLNPEKQGKYMPGVHLPIYPPDRIFETRPDYVLVLPWNEKYTEEHVDYIAAAVRQAAQQLRRK